MSVEETSGSWEMGVMLFVDEQAQYQVVETSHDMGGVPFRHPRAVFAQSDIAAVVQPIFDAPIRACELEQTLWEDFFFGEAGATIDNLFLNFAGFEAGKPAYQFENLFKVGPVQEILVLW